MNVFQLATLTGWCIIIAGRVENPDIASFHIVAQPAQEAENGVSAASCRCQAEAQFMALFHELRYYTTPNRETEKDSWRLELWMFWLCFEGGEKITFRFIRLKFSEAMWQTSFWKGEEILPKVGGRKYHMDLSHAVAGTSPSNDRATSSKLLRIKMHAMSRISPQLIWFWEKKTFMWFQVRIQHYKKITNYTKKAL